MDLDKFEDKQVAAISELQKRSDELKLVAVSMTITDTESLKGANEIVKQINAHKKEVKEKRLALTQPLNNVVNQLIAKEKEVLLPLDEGKSEISEKILTYQEEQERIRAEEERRIQAITYSLEYFAEGTMFTVEDVDKNEASLKSKYEELPETDKNHPSIKVAFMTTVGKLTDCKNQIIEEERAEAERKRQAEEQKRLDAERAKQSEEEARLAAERKAHEDEKRAIEEEKAAMAREKEELERAKEIQKAEAEQFKLEKQAAKNAKAAPKSNIVETLSVEVHDEDLVPRKYCSPDLVKIRAAIKAAQLSGVSPFEIAGVKLTKDKKVR